MEFLTYPLIGVTALISGLALTAVPRILDEGMLRPYVVFHENRWYQLITHAFLHADFGHLALNMITLFFFGPLLEQTVGASTFMMLYISGAVVSSIPTLFKHRNRPNYASLGASGAVESVLFSFIIFYPFERIYLMLIPIGIPAILFGVLFLGYSYWESMRGRGNINHDAHIAGAIWGVIFTFAVVPHSVDHFFTMLRNM